jgi:hypothetical protein
LPEEAIKTAEHDWTSDCPAGKDGMGYMDFFNAMFELCDHWTDGTEIADYEHLLRQFEAVHLDAEKTEIARREEEARIWEENRYR